MLGGEQVATRQPPLITSQLEFARAVLQKTRASAYEIETHAQVEGRVAGGPLAISEAVETLRRDGSSRRGAGAAGTAVGAGQGRGQTFRTARRRGDVHAEIQQPRRPADHRRDRGGQSLDRAWSTFPTAPSRSATPCSRCRKTRSVRWCCAGTSAVNCCRARAGSFDSRRRCGNCLAASFCERWTVQRSQKLAAKQCRAARPFPRSTLLRTTRPLLASWPPPHALRQVVEPAADHRNSDRSEY